MGRFHPAVAVVPLLVLATCRDGVPLFTPTEREVEAPPIALTFGYGQDADPQWSLSSDTILYHTNESIIAPQVDGVVLVIPAAGGTAAPLMPEIQTPGARPFITPVLSPDGDRFAYMDLVPVGALGACTRTEPPPPGVEELEPRCTAIQPLLDSAVLRVRRVGEHGPVQLDPSVPVGFAGPDPRRFQGYAGPWFEQLFPFQAQHRVENAMLFRPSWAPDGERLVFSDGLALRMWNVGADAASIVPGTDDGVSAAWSPDGEWIAFAEYARTDSTTYACRCLVGRESHLAMRTVYESDARVVLVRPDGSERLDLGEGDDPAWSPDGSWIYLRRDDRIVRVPRAGGAATVIPNTERGRAPAVSPDGSQLAFSRRKPQLTLDYDIWVVPLVQ